MSLIEQNKQVTNGSAQLNAIEPKFEMIAKQYWDMGDTSATEVAAVFVGISYVLIGGLIVEGIRGGIHYANSNNYDQLCQKYAKLHFEILNADGKNVSDKITDQNKTATELRGRIVKAIGLGKADVEEIKEAAQYKLQQAICKTARISPDADVEDADPKVKKAAVKASAKLIEDLDTRIAREKVNAYVDEHKFRLDEADLEDLAADLDVSPDLVKEIAGKKLHKDIGSGKEGERKLKEAKKLLRGEELSNAVEADVKVQIKKLQKAVTERSETISKYKEASKAIKTLDQKLNGLKEELEGDLEDGDGLNVELKAKEDELEKLVERLGGDDKKSKPKTKLETEIKDLKKTISEKESEIHKLTKKALGLEKTLKECEKARTKAEEKYAKLIKELFGIQSNGSVRRESNEKNLKNEDAQAIIEAGTPKGKDDNGKMKFHKLPGNVENKIVKKALKDKFKAKDADRVALANEEFKKARKEAEDAKLKKDEVKISDKKKAELDYQTRSMTGAIATLLGAFQNRGPNGGGGNPNNNNNNL